MAQRCFKIPMKKKEAKKHGWCYYCIQCKAWHYNEKVERQ